MLLIILHLFLCNAMPSSFSQHLYMLFLRGQVHCNQFNSNFTACIIVIDFNVPFI